MWRQILVSACVSTLLWKQNEGALCNTNDRFGEDDPKSKDDHTDSNTDFGYLMSDNDYIIDCCGVVDRWEAFFDNVAGSRTVYFQIWRLTSGTTYEMVGENDFTVTSSGEQNKNIAVSSRITVQPNDKIGWWSSGTDIIAYKDGGGGQADDNWMMTTADINEGDTLNWGSATIEDNRSYAVRVDVEPNTDPTFTNLPSSTSIFNSDPSGNTLITIAVDDVDTYDVSSLSVVMTANSQFSFDTSTRVLTTGTITSTGSTEILVFRVSDQCDNTATASYTVTIVNTPPVIENLPASTTLSEDTTVKTLLHTINVTDTDTVTCSMASSVPGSYPFTVELVSSSYGIYSSASPAFSYTTKSSYDLTVDCTDTATTVSGTFAVYLIQNSPPVIVNLQNSTSVATSDTIGTTVFTVLTTDAEGDSLSYTMTCTPVSCPFNILASGAIQTTQDLTLHTTVGYDLAITVADARSTVGPETLTITVTAGVVSTAGSVLNYETLGSTTFTFSVTVTDTVATDTQNLVIDVVNVNEAPVFSPTSYSLTTTEGSAGTSIGTPTFGVTDPDTSDTKAYTMDCGSHTAYFQIATATGKVTYQTDYDLDSTTLPSVVTCTVTVTDSGSLTDTTTLTINISDINDNTPTFLPTSYTFYMSYYSGVGTAVGTTTATDADSGAFGTFTYSLNQVTLGAGYFAIDSGGVISLAQSPAGTTALNYSSSATITAIATDSGGLSSSATVTIVVSDTTTVSTTVETNTYKTFFDDPHNWAWFIPCMLALFATTAVTCWVVYTCKGEKGCEAFLKKLCKKRGFKPRKTSRPFQGHSNSRARAMHYRNTTIDEEHMSVRKPPPSVDNQSWRRHRVFD